jgi:putative ABC transport system ATP-binding protein
VSSDPRVVTMAMEVSGRMAENASQGFVLDEVSVQRSGVTLLDGVTCRIPAGACTALVGPSGAGKSTLLRLLNRLEDPTSGTISLYDQPLSALDALALRRRVVLVAQQPVLLTDTILNDLRVGRPELTDQQAATLLERVGLPAGMLHRTALGLSGGEAQRVCLARALAVEPEVLLLDEPTSALDAVSITAVEHLVAELVATGLTVVLVSHDIARARRISRQILVLNGGRLAEQGHPDHISYLITSST